MATGVAGRAADGGAAGRGGHDGRGRALRRRERLFRALRALPARQRAVVVLRHYDDHTEAEVARMLGCSVGTVKSHCARGLAALRDALAADVLPLGGPAR